MCRGLMATRRHGRAVNEVWREHAFQLAVTFHGGMVGMAYEWGSPDHPHRKDNAGNWQVIIGKGREMSRQHWYIDPVLLWGWGNGSLSVEPSPWCTYATICCDASCTSCCDTTGNLFIKMPKG